MSQRPVKGKAASAMLRVDAKDARTWGSCYDAEENDENTTMLMIWGKEAQIDSRTPESDCNKDEEGDVRASFVVTTRHILHIQPTTPKQHHASTMPVFF